MGGNASPLIADLFLANLDFRYMDKLVSSKLPDNLRMVEKLSNNSRYIRYMDKLVSSKLPDNLRMVEKLSNNSRCIDDIGVCNMNHINDFMICSKDIYPDSIPLTAGCIENHKDTFLDLDITIEGNRFITKIYHRVEDFDIKVISFPFPTSNMADHITC